MFGPSVAPDLDRALVVGGFCFLAMTVCPSLIILSEPITFNKQVLITNSIVTALEKKSSAGQKGTKMLRGWWQT